MVYDLVIIGAGPAGISAALYAARQKLNFLVVTKDIGGLANFVPSLKTYLGIYYISGYNLIKKFTEHMKNFQVPVRENEGVAKIKSIKNGFSIITDKNEYKTKSVIIASGRRFKRLGIKGETKLENKGLSYCAACDGPLFRNKTVAIIGGGRSGLFSALYMLSIAKKIYLIEKEANIKEEGGVREVAKVVKNNKKVEILTATDTKEIIGDKFVNAVKIFRNGKPELIKIDGVFVEIGYEPNTDFAKDLVELNNRGEIIIDKNNMSDVPGIFAAGDVTDLHDKQVVVAVGEGAKATLSAITYLERIGKT